MSENQTSQKSIIKSTGEVEKFSVDKLKRSLARAGAHPELVEQIATKVKDNAQKFETTEDIHRFALSELKENYLPIADRYDLKRAVLKLGPSGFPFEKYIGSLFRALGYDVKLNQIMDGECITHEVDALISKEGKTELVEVKFHNHNGIKTSVQTTLYVKSRFDDLRAVQNQPELSGVWIVTNTSFSGDATTYAGCKNIQLLSWDSPEENSLVRLIDRLGLHPLTAMSLLEDHEIRKLLNSGIVLCSQLIDQPESLREFGIDADRKEMILKEAVALCNLKPVL